MPLPSDVPNPAQPFTSKPAPKAGAKLLAVKGMNDILPPESTHWEWLEQVLRQLMWRYAYRNLRTPVLEPTALFVRGLGEVTDIVEKEMYAFEDRLNGEHLTLRPENTAPVVRAAVEHNLLYEGPKRLYYMGPMFRHERPQRGRYRQFHQFGAEVLGLPGPDVDVELMVMVDDLWRSLGLTGIELEINSLGQLDERKAHRQALIAYFEAHSEQLDADAQRRLHSNPLRILDTKNPAMQALVEGAPHLMNFLGVDSLAHFAQLRAGLDAHGVAYRINPRLVRGMDYYNLSVFEFVTQSLGAQGTVCAGGRYDGLFEQLGGKPTPAVGWAMGLERLLELLKLQGCLPAEMPPDAYAVLPDLDRVFEVMAFLRELRNLGVSVQMHPQSGTGMASMKAQFKKADASAAPFALVFGEQEWLQGQVALKALRAPANVAQAPQPQTLHLLSDAEALAQRLLAARSAAQSATPV